MKTTPKKTVANNSNTIPKNIEQFIRKHHVFNMAASDNTHLWTASCFYAYWKERQCLVFLSDEETLHAKLMTINPEIVATITLETRIVGKIQGIQLKGIVSRPSDELLSMCKKIYYKRFPYAIGQRSTFWILELTYIKYTDNKLGFGKKLYWEKEPSNKTISQ